jgi:putative ABC transport system permease protein
METLKFTFRIIKKRPLRSLLTVLQVALGVWIVAVILSLNFGFAGRLADINENFGKSLARINISKYGEYQGVRVMVDVTNNLRYGDLARLREGRYIEDAFIMEDLWSQTIVVDNVAYTVMSAVEASAEYAEALGLQLLEGQFFTEADVEQKNRVVLLSEPVARQLWPNQSALGKTINLVGFDETRTPFQVIGVFKSLPALLDLFVTQANLIYPLESTRVLSPDADYEPVYQNIYIKAAQGRIYEAVEEASVLLADRAVEDLTVNAQYVQESNSYLLDQMDMMNFILGAFAFIAVLVSAIGILSIMLVSVVERTREVGLRQALGASKASIVAQILNESLVFSLTGSVLGVIAAYLTSSSLIGTLMQEGLYAQFDGGIEPSAALVAVVVAVAMGQLFGLYPAWQAARMAPVEALREG